MPIFFIFCLKLAGFLHYVNVSLIINLIISSSVLLLNGCPANSGWPFFLLAIAFDL